MKSAPFFKRDTPQDPELLALRTELFHTREELAYAYHQFDLAVDPDLVESCIYQINAVNARYNYLIRSIKERCPECAVAARIEGSTVWT